MDGLYSETIYHVPDAVTLVLRQPLKELPEAARTLVLNLCSVIKSRPAPALVVQTAGELLQGKLPSGKIIALGHDLPGLTVNQVHPFREGQLVLTTDPEILAGKPEEKKVLWAAIRQLGGF